MARRRGMKVEGFAIGFGPKIFSWTRDGIEYSWRWIPAGGFVKLPQMITSEALEGARGSAELTPPAPPWSKILVAVAGRRRPAPSVVRDLGPVRRPDRLAHLPARRDARRRGAARRCDERENDDRRYDDATEHAPRIRRSFNDPLTGSYVFDHRAAVRDRTRSAIPSGIARTIPTSTRIPIRAQFVPPMSGGCLLSHARRRLNTVQAMNAVRGSFPNTGPRRCAVAG